LAWSIISSQSLASWSKVPFANYCFLTEALERYTNFLLVDCEKFLDNHRLDSSRLWCLRSACFDLTPWIYWRFCCWLIRRHKGGRFRSWICIIVRAVFSSFALIIIWIGSLVQINIKMIKNIDKRYENY